MIFEPSTSNRDSEVCKRVVTSVFTIIYIYLCYDASKNKHEKVNLLSISSFLKHSNTIYYLNQIMYLLE